MRRIAAIDYGLKRIGLAISDASAKLALPLQTISAQKTLDATAHAVLQALAPYKNELRILLVGLPLLMNGTKGDMALAVERFADALRTASNLPVECVDERLTSAAAERSLKELDLSRKQRKKTIDSVSAALLLQAYLDRQA